MTIVKYSKFLNQFIQITPINILLVILTILFTTIPLLTDDILNLADNMIVRLALIFMLIGSFYYTKSPIVSIFSLLVIGRIFIERNNRKLLSVKRIITSSKDEEKEIVDEQGDIVDTNISINREVNGEIEAGLDYFPTDGLNDEILESSMFENSMNDKQVMEEAIRGEAAAQRMYGDVRPNSDISSNLI